MSFKMTQQTMQKHWTLIQESESVKLRKNFWPKFVDGKQMTPLSQFLNVFWAMKANSFAVYLLYGQYLGCHTCTGRLSSD